MAGLDYDTPWTRDAALNTWYSLGLLAPHVAKNTLLSVLMREPGGDVRIGGQYWDAIIWAHGAWQYYLYTSDREFLELALPAVKNSLRFFEATEFDPADGLFRGGACFQDGVAGYPDYFAHKDQLFGGILSWLEYSSDKRVKTGEGIPCKALSTNCLYYRAYHVVDFMAAELGQPAGPAWKKKAGLLYEAINERFWSEEMNSYRYFVDAPDNDDRQEGFGLAFALLFGLADNAKAERIFDSVYLTPHGMPCVWPTYDRYNRPGEYGRHSGTIWPQVNAAWALACHKFGQKDLALYELKLLAEKACRDLEFVEVYHPDTGLPYGGLQESDHGIKAFHICHRQSWCASGYIAMVLFCQLGLGPVDDRPLSESDRAKIWAKIPKITFKE